MKKSIFKWYDNLSLWPRIFIKAISVSLPFYFCCLSIFIRCKSIQRHNGNDVLYSFGCFWFSNNICRFHISIMLFLL